MLHLSQVKGRLQKVDDSDIDLLVDPVLLGRGPVTELLRLEPESNLVVGGLNSIGAMADVAPNLMIQTLFSLKANELLELFELG